MYTLAGDEGNFAISGDGQVTVARTLDREMTPSYSLTVTAQDRGQPRNSANSILNFDLSDINDNVPTFEQVHTIV